LPYTNCCLVSKKRHALTINIWRASGVNGRCDGAEALISALQGMGLFDRNDGQAADAVLTAVDGLEAHLARRDPGVHAEGRLCASTIWDGDKASVRLDSFGDAVFVADPQHSSDAGLAQLKERAGEEGLTVLDGLPGTLSLEELNLPVHNLNVRLYGGMERLSQALVEMRLYEGGEGPLLDDIASALRDVDTHLRAWSLRDQRIAAPVYAPHPVIDRQDLGIYLAFDGQAVLLLFEQSGDPSGNHWGTISAEAAQCGIAVQQVPALNVLRNEAQVRAALTRLEGANGYDRAPCSLTGQIEFLRELRAEFPARDSSHDAIPGEIYACGGCHRYQLSYDGAIYYSVGQHRLDAPWARVLGFGMSA
jgi:hypothetical protein